MLYEVGGMRLACRQRARRLRNDDFGSIGYKDWTLEKGNLFPWFSAYMGLRSACQARRAGRGVSVVSGHS